MKRSPSLLLFFITLLILPTVAHAQAWSGIINSSRATDWTGVGISGGVPSGSWTQCGSTIAAYSGSASTITRALASCGANHYVQLGAGTFNLTSAIAFPTTGHVVLRGMGANSTFLAAPASGLAGCQLGSALICIQSSDGTYINEPSPIIYGWTAGYAQGTNQITLSSKSGISTTNPTILVLEQCETGYTASSPTAACTGNAVDNGNLFICSDAYSGAGQTGCSFGPGNENVHRGQFEMTTATAINGNVVTIANPLRYPNWNSGQRPRVWIAQPIVQVGVENLAIDDTANGANDLIQFFNAYQWWVSGCKFTNWGRWAVESLQTLNGIVQNSYFDHSTGADSYGVRFEGGSNNLIQNNIITQVFAPVVFDGPTSGNVIAYNFVINDNYPSDFLRGSFFEHAVNSFDLYEGNVADNQWNDGDHGTANMITRFRNFFTGWESCANGQCGSATTKDGWTNAFVDPYGDRYQNNVANVLGTPGFHSTYQTSGPSGWNGAVEVLGGSQGSIPSDSLVKTTSLFWGNYDVVTGTVRWCGNSSDTGWSSTCSSTSEVPSGISPYSIFPPER